MATGTQCGGHMSGRSRESVVVMYRIRINYAVVSN